MIRSVRGLQLEQYQSKCDHKDVMATEQCNGSEKDKSPREQGNIKLTRSAIRSDPTDLLQKIPVNFVEEIETFFDNGFRRADGVMGV